MALRAVLYGALLPLVLSDSHWPAQADFAPLVPVAAFRSGVEVPSATAGLWRLTDKDAGPEGSRVHLADPEGALKVTFRLPTDLPRLGAIALVGQGSVRISYVDDAGGVVAATAALGPAGSFGHTHPIPRDRRVMEVTLSGDPADPSAFLTDVRLLSLSLSEESQPKWLTQASGPTLEGSSPISDSIESWGPDIENPAKAPGASADPTGDTCVCVGPSANLPLGNSCGEWDADCKGSGGWCYVRYGACADGVNSTKFPWQWSCTPCRASPSPAAIAAPLSPSPPLPSPKPPLPAGPSPTPAATPASPSPAAPDHATEDAPAVVPEKCPDASSPAPSPAPCPTSSCGLLTVIALVGGFVGGIAATYGVIRRCRPSFLAPRARHLYAFDSNDTP